MALRRPPSPPDDQINLRYYVQKADGRLEERLPNPACPLPESSTLSAPLVFDLVQRARFLSQPDFDDTTIKADISASLKEFRQALTNQNFAEQERLRDRLRELHIKLDRILTLKERARLHPSGIILSDTTAEAPQAGLFGKCKQAINCVAAAIKRSC